MTALNKQALRQLATDAHELGIIKRYTKGIEANKRFIAIATPLTVLELLDENLQLQRDKDSLEAVAIAMRDDMRDAREKLEAAEKRIAELEARTVTLPTPYPKGYGLVSDKYNFALEECADAIRAAGIGVKGE
ncbi:ead/Ea22-like family protein [Citrobacter braakii]|uniref:ead/Ea22-like family protein n=1 Tax=Citrobacter braakii TaxID=57706 RepID=UPI000691CE06|nr:ead/Ea22-like family protein [Citrobacter braakii]